jgi:hypothetical protein
VADEANHRGRKHASERYDLGCSIRVDKSAGKLPRHHGQEPPPDVAVPADEALDVAQVRILRSFLEQERDPEMRERLASRISKLE